MPLDLRKFNQLQTAVKQAQSDSDRAAGALDGVMAKLKVDYGVATLAAAEKLAAKLDAEAKLAEAQFAEALEEFETEWGERLG